VKKKPASNSCFLRQFHQFIGYLKQMAAAVSIAAAVKKGVRTHQEGGSRSRLDPLLSWQSVSQ